MIKEAYVSYEIAKLLKKKGFDERTLYHYTNCDVLQHNIVYNKYKNSEMLNAYSAPTHQMACAWLREVHLIHIYAEYKAFFQEKPKKVYYHWMPFVKTLPNCSIYNSEFPNSLDIYCDNYEEAIEAALKYTLEKLI